jgi:hypothetical protein
MKTTQIKRPEGTKYWCSLLTVLLTLFVLGSHAQAQCGFQDASLTGDDQVDVIHDFGWVFYPNLRKQAFYGLGINENHWNVDVNGNQCSNTLQGAYEDPNCGSRRLLNMLAVMEATPFGNNNYSWRDWVAARVKSTNYVSTCEFLGLNSQDWDGNLFCWLNGDCTESHVDLYEGTIFSDDVLSRASVYAHEGRHDDKGHNANGWCEGTTVSCDSSWGYNGANAYEVKYIHQALNEYDVVMTEPIRAESYARANARLNRRFKYHPGFNLEKHPMIPAGNPDAEKTYWTWSNGNMEAAHFANPDGPIRGIRAIGLTVNNNHIVRLDVSWQTITENGLTPGSTWDNSHGAHRNTVGLERNATLPAGYFVTRVRVKSTNDNITGICLTGRQLVGGLPLGSVTTACDGPVGGSPDIDFSVPSGMIMTSVGFSSGNSTKKVSFGAYRATLHEGFEIMGGGHGGTGYLLECAAGKVPIGVLAKSNYSTTWNTDVVGFFGLLCADANLWQPGVNAWQAFGSIDVVHGTHYDKSAGKWYGSGSQPYLTINNGKWYFPSGSKLGLCGKGSQLRGLGVKAGAVVDSIGEVMCSNYQDTDLNVGGNGGYYEHQDCWFAPGPETGNTTMNMNGVYVRTGWYLDAIAPRCKMN